MAGPRLLGGALLQEAARAAGRWPGGSKNKTYAEAGWPWQERQFRHCQFHSPHQTSACDGGSLASPTSKYRLGASQFPEARFEGRTLGKRGETAGDQTFVESSSASGTYEMQHVNSMCIECLLL